MPISSFLNEVTQICPLQIKFGVKFVVPVRYKI